MLTSPPRKRVRSPREQIDSTLYDAFTPRDMLPTGPDVGKASLRMFGNRNIGNCAMTNMQIGNALADDQTFVIVTWYARTNISDVTRFQGAAPYQGLPAASFDLMRAWDAWANSTVADLTIGSKPLLTRPLSELLGPRVFGSACGNPGPERDDIRVLAEKMWKRYLDSTLGDRDGSRLAPTFGDLPRSDQERWLAAAGVYPFFNPVIIPIRQNFSVKLQSDAKATTALLKVLPENIAPCPLVWVHLDGVLTRDYY